MKAQQRVELATLCLLIGAWGNAAGMFLGPGESAYTPSFALGMTLLILNGLWITFFAALIWAFGLRVLSGVAKLIYWLLGMRERVAREVWLDTMYAALWPLPWAALGGLALWLLWSGMFFFLRAPGAPLYAFALGTLGHLLAAWVYGNVGWQWWKLRRSSQRTEVAAA